MTTIKNVQKPVNPGRLTDELIAAGIPVVSFGAPGFEKTRNRVRNINSGPEVYHREHKKGAPDVILTAQPGDIHIFTEVDLDAPQLATIDAVLASHDSTQLSDEQVEEDIDAADRVTLKAVKDSGRNLSPDEVKKLNRLVLRGD